MLPLLLLCLQRTPCLRQEAHAENTMYPLEQLTVAVKQRKSLALLPLLSAAALLFSLCWLLLFSSPSKPHLACTVGSAWSAIVSSGTTASTPPFCTTSSTSSSAGSAGSAQTSKHSSSSSAL
jgi:hypothetical protein